MKTTITKSNFLKTIPLFTVLSEEELETFGQRVEIEVKPKQEFVYLPDELSTHLFFLMEGSIKIGTHSSDGREVIKSVLYPTAVFGELGLVGQTHRIDYAKAMGSGIKFCSVAVKDFKALMRSNHKLCLKVFEMIGERLNDAESRLESLILKDARTRIIDFLKDSANKRGRKVGYEMLVKHSLTQQDIANITGTSRQTVTSVLNELRKSNLIYFNRRSILIRDLQSLQ